jgi:hypothetical protein
MKLSNRMNLLRETDLWWLGEIGTAIEFRQSAYA